jgi:hypothetical protein
VATIPNVLIGLDLLAFMSLPREPLLIVNILFIVPAFRMSE